MAIPSEQERRQKEIEEYAHGAATGPGFKLAHNEKDEADYREAMRESGPYLTLGIQLAMFIAVMAGLGYWIDSSNGTSPFWLAILSAAGAVMGLAFFLMTVIRLSRKEEEAKSLKK